MRKSTKASLLSMLIFPGAGHLYLKKRALGILLCVGAAVASYFIISSAVQTALEVVGNIQHGSTSLDAGTIMDLVSQRSRGSEDSINLAITALLIFWLIGIFDSFRVGRMLEKTDSASGSTET